MRTKKTFTVIGGDLRQAHLANKLASKENDCTVYGMFLEKNVRLSGRIQQTDDIKLVLPQSDIVVFPLPLLDTRGYVNTPLSEKNVLLDACLDYAMPESILLAGMVTSEAAAAACRRGLEMVDYYKREEYIVANAVPTAEGALEIALRELPITLAGSVCMVLGYGRIGKVLAKQLVALGAEVRVAARKHSDLTWAEINGCEPVPIERLSEQLPGVDVLFNTIPAMLLDEGNLSLLSRNCLVIDLSSKPGGVDFETAKHLGLKTIWALSLPGRCAPITAGDITFDTMMHILQERGIV